MHKLPDIIRRVWQVEGKVCRQRKEVFFPLRDFFLCFGREGIECGYIEPERMLGVIRLVGGAPDFSRWGDFVKYMKKDIPESQREEVVLFFVEGVEALEAEFENESYFRSIMDGVSEKIIDAIRGENILIYAEEEYGANKLLEGLGIRLDIRAFTENVPLMSKEFLRGILDLLEEHKARWRTFDECLSG